MLTQTAPSIDVALEYPPLAARDFPLCATKSRPVHVLVVDDEPLVRWSVAETLGTAGFQVIDVGSGEAAIIAVMKGGSTTDVVLLDLLLPDYRDLSLLAVLRRLVPKVPIIMMTAFATPEVVARARKLGAFAIVNKPFEMNALAPLISQALLAAQPS